MESSAAIELAKQTLMSGGLVLAIGIVTGLLAQKIKVSDVAAITSPPAAGSCQRCRGCAEGRKAAPDELRSIRNALWSDVPAIAEGAARVLSQCKEPWAREAIEESFIDDAIKAEILN